MESHDKQQLAKDLYLQADKTQTEIAEILDVNRKTIYLWSKKGKWEQIKQALLLSPSAILHDLYSHIGRVNEKIFAREDQCPIMQDVEMLRKLVKMTKDIPKKHSGFYIEAIEDFSYFLSRRNPESVKQYMPIADEFIRGMAEDNPFRPGKRISDNFAEIEQRLKKDAERYVAEEESLINETSPKDEIDQAEELIFDGLKFVPVTKNAAEAVVMSCRDERPLETLEGAPQQKQTGNSGVSVLSPKGPSKPATVKDSNGIYGETKCPISSAKISDKNGVSPVENKTERTPLRNINTIIAPPPKRPAPFREGNIIWINHPKDLDDYEKHLKMSDSIRYYPESDPSLKKDR